MKQIIKHSWLIGALLAAAVPERAAGQVTVKDSSLTKDTISLRMFEVKGNKPFLAQSVDRITLNVAESPVAAGSNAYDVIKRAPGVLADQSGKLSVRGRSVAVWIDGRPSNLSGDELNALLQTMNGSGLDKVEIITHPSARYDAQGGAIINIKTIKGRSLGMNGTITAGAGAGRFARYNSGLGLNYRSRQVNVYGSYDYGNNQVYLDNHSTRSVGSSTTITENEYDKRKRSNNNFKLGLDYEINKTTSLGVLAKGYLNYRDREVVNNTAIGKLQQPDSLSNVATTGTASIFSPSVNLYFKRVLNKKGSEVTVNADYFYYHKSWEDNFITRFYDSPEKPYSYADTLSNRSPANNKVYALAADYVYPAKWGRLEAGVKTTRTTTDNDVVWESAVNGAWETDAGKTNHFIFKENINAAYVNYSQTFGKYNIQAGLRAEQTSTEGYSVTLQQKDKNDYLYLFPNLSLQYAPSAKHVWGLGYKRNIMRYGFDYVNPFILYHSQYSYSQGNPYIKPQIDNSVELSYIYNSKISANLTYAYSGSSLQQVYRQDTASKLVISTYDNLSNANLLSLTVTASTLIGKSAFINTIGGIYSGYHGATSTTVLNNNAFAAYLQSSYSIKLSRQLSAEATGLFTSPMASGIFRISSMYKIDAGISKTILQDRGSVKLSVSDVFNSMRSRYTVNNYQNVNGAYNNKIETQFFNLLFNYKFGNQYVKGGKNRKTGVDELRTRMGTN